VKQIICRFTGVDGCCDGSPCANGLVGRAAGRSITATGEETTATGRCPEEKIDVGGAGGASTALPGAWPDGWPDICATRYWPETDVIAFSVSRGSGTSFLGGMKSAIGSRFS
jgi:hypothetical protein